MHTAVGNMLAYYTFTASLLVAVSKAVVLREQLVDNWPSREPQFVYSEDSNSHVTVPVTSWTETTERGNSPISQELFMFMEMKPREQELKRLFAFNF